MTREQKLMAELKVEAEALCAKILKAMGPQKQVVAMNALYLAMQVVDSVSWRDAKPTNVEVRGSRSEAEGTTSAACGCPARLQGYAKTNEG